VVAGRGRTVDTRGMIDARTGAAETARLVAGGVVTAREVTDAAIGRIEALNPPLNAISQLLADRARAEADDRDRQQAAGERIGPLHGVPVVVKEEIAVGGCVTTFGGEGNSTPAAADAEVVRRLREAGAVVVATTTMPEFGAFPYTESVSRGITHNPWDRTRTPGGSSGGTAAAVASGMVPVGLGGDGGGSIRIPSACCGLFGLKPQRGRVSTAPNPHLWFALGTIGPLSRTVLDSALVYDAIRGNGPGDRFAAEDRGSFVAAAQREPGRLRIGWSTTSVAIGVRPDRVHVEATRRTAGLLAELGHDVRQIEPHFPDPTLVFATQFFAGIRDEASRMEHFDRLEKRTRETCRLGAWVRPGVLDRALRGSERIAQRANRVFDEVDVLLTPAIAHRPPRVGVLDNRGTIQSVLRALPAVAYAALWNVAGNPAASIPRGTAADGLPVAVQLVGRPHEETTLLSLAAQLEAAHPWPLLAGDSGAVG
jgi:amidase